MPTTIFLTNWSFSRNKFKMFQDVATAAAALSMQDKKLEALALLASAAPALFAARKQANALALQLTVVQTKFRRRALGLPPE